MSECTDPNCGEHIKCKRCGDTTNHAPDYFPPELDGYCPECAVDGMEAGWLPKPSPAAMLEYIAGAVSNQLERALEGGVNFNWQPMSNPSQTSQAFIVTQCLN